MIENKQQWYSEKQATLLPEEEERYFEEINQMIFLLHTLELRLIRHRDLVPLRYEALRQYLMQDPRLKVTDGTNINVDISSISN